VTDRRRAKSILPGLAIAALALVALAPSPAHAGYNDLLVSNLGGANVTAYNPLTGAPDGSYGTGNLLFPRGVVVGPDHNVYVGDIGGTQNIQRFDGTTGAFLGTFVNGRGVNLQNPYGLAFGPDGNLYVSSFNTNQVLEFNGKTGASIPFGLTGAPSASGVSGLVNPAGLLFDASGNIFVASSGNGTTQEYDSQGHYLRSYGAGQSQPAGIAVGNGILFVALGTPGSGVINEWSLATGALLGQINDPAHINTPGGIIYDPYANRLYVASNGNDSVLVYNTLTNTLDRTLISGAAGGLHGPIDLAYTPVPEPAAFALMGLGCFGVAGYAWRRSRSQSTPA